MRAGATRMARRMVRMWSPLAPGTDVAPGVAAMGHRATSPADRRQSRDRSEANHLERGGYLVGPARLLPGSARLFAPSTADPNPRKPCRAAESSPTTTYVLIGKHGTQGMRRNAAREYNSHIPGWQPWRRDGR